MVPDPPLTNTSPKSPLQGLSEYAPHTPPQLDTQRAQMRPQRQQPLKTLRVGIKPDVPERYPKYFTAKIPRTRMPTTLQALFRLLAEPMLCKTGTSPWMSGWHSWSFWTKSRVGARMSYPTHVQNRQPPEVWKTLFGKPCGKSYRWARVYPSGVLKPYTAHWMEGWKQIITHYHLVGFCPSLLIPLPNVFFHWPLMV